MKKNAPEITNVIAGDMCIACGACVYTCPYKVIEPVFDHVRGAYEVQITSTEYCPECSAPCDKVCPSIEVDFALLTGAEGRPFDRVGTIHSVQIGYSPTHRDNGISSSGGIIRALAVDALENGSPVICLSKVGQEYEPALLSSMVDLDLVPGSIYHSVSFDKCIGILRQLERPCVLISTPCQLEGIRNFIRKIEPALNDQIELSVGLICGWMYNHHALNAFAKYKNIAGNILDAGYRGEDRVGLLKIKTNSGNYTFQRRQFANLRERFDYRASFSRYTNRLRCRVCEDHTNVLADVVVGDAWLKRYQDQKVSIVLARTDKGEKVLRQLESRGKVILEMGSLDDLMESQSENLAYGLEAQELNRFLNARGFVTPRFIFNEGPIYPKETLKDAIEFNAELFIRKIIQSRRYGLFRFIYIMVTVLRKVLFQEARKIEAAE